MTKEARMTNALGRATLCGAVEYSKRFRRLDRVSPYRRSSFGFRLPRRSCAKAGHSFVLRHSSFRDCFCRKVLFTRENSAIKCSMRDSHLEDLYSFLRFPSISTDSDYAGKVSDCAHWLSQKLE